MPRAKPKPKVKPKTKGKAAAIAIAIAKLGDRAAALIELFMLTHLRHMDRAFAGKPFRLEAWQRDGIIRPIFGTLDRYGRRLYQEAIIGLSRNGGKSAIAAAICLAVMFTEPVYEGEYVVVARNRKQAGIVFNRAKRMIYADPLLRAACEIYKNEIVVKETGQRFYTVAYDAGGAQGIHAQVVVIDEYHVHKDSSMRYALLSGMIGQANSLLVTISTAGTDRKGPLWDLLKSAAKDPRAYVYWVGASDDDDGHDPKIWRKANPQSWVKIADLRAAHKAMPFPEFERYHLNRFPTSSTNRAYSGQLWHAGDAKPKLVEGADTILGLDASFLRDTTSLIADQCDAGMHNVLAWVWGSGRPMGDIDHEVVEATILELCELYNVIRIVCDPNYFRASMRRLEDEFGLPVEQYPQNSQRMAAASMTLFDILLEERMRHGDDPELTSAVLNCGVKPTPYGWRIDRITEDAKIDAAVALAIAAYIAEAEAPPAPSFAATGGLHTIKLG